MRRLEHRIIGNINERQPISAVSIVIAKYEHTSYVEKVKTE